MSGYISVNGRFRDPLRFAYPAGSTGDKLSVTMRMRLIGG
jgi:hypothetical protein